MRVLTLLTSPSIALTLLGCASAVCRPVTIVVANKQEMSRLETGPSPIGTTETGALREAVRPTIVREYWVKTQEGHSYQVSAEQFTAAQIGGPLQVCE